MHIQKIGRLKKTKQFVKQSNYMVSRKTLGTRFPTIWMENLLISATKDGSSTWILILPKESGIFNKT